MTSDLDSSARIKETMAVDLARFVDQGMPPRAIVDRLIEIPEVGQGMHLRASRTRPLALDPATREQCQEIADALDRIIAWLDDGFHDELVDELSEIAAAVTAA